MKPFLVIVLACLFCCGAVAETLQEQNRRIREYFGPRSDELVLISKCDIRGTNDAARADLMLTLVNMSKRELTVLTKNPYVGTDGHMLLTHFAVMFDEQSLQRRRGEMLTIEDLGPVTLKPGEVARMVAPYPYGQDVPPNTRVCVLYRIDRKFAEKHGLWGGWVESIPNEPRYRTASTRR